MKPGFSLSIAFAVVAGTSKFFPAMAGEQEAIDGRIDKLRAVCSLDGRAGGEVLSWEFSGVATRVLLRVGAQRVGWLCSLTKRRRYAISRACWRTGVKWKSNWEQVLAASLDY
jgi:frataxin-like iron-binding protein CyaY